MATKTLIDSLKGLISTVFGISELWAYKHYVWDFPVCVEVVFIALLLIHDKLVVRLRQRSRELPQ